MNAVVFLADGFEEIEALTVVDYLRRAGVSVSTVAVPSSTMNGGNVVSAAHGVKVFADMTFGDFEKEYSARLPDAVYVPGGMPGALNVASCAQVLSFIEKCFAAGKYVSAICAAPAVVLSQTGVLRGSAGRAILKCKISTQKTFLQTVPILMTFLLFRTERL